ncbi:hypothetical protein [Streptomyces sp. NPDC048349]|uniref:hypothetical protein n=1 Tax=Streptomyces sp. NPDC048349 TaxID=3155486 RepID=UPI003417B38A
MRLRTTAAVFAGALALVLPPAGPALADDDGGRGLGTLHYRFIDEAGGERRAQIRPADNDTCYLLTGTSSNEPAIDVVNNTRSRAFLYDDRGCSGRADRVLEPGERARNVEVVAAFFRPADGRGEGGDGHGDGGNGGGGDGGDGWGDGGNGGGGHGGDGWGGGGGDGGDGWAGGGGDGGDGWAGGGGDGRGEGGGRGDQGRGDQAGEGGGGTWDQGGESRRGDGAADPAAAAAERRQDLFTGIFRTIG